MAKSLREDALNDGKTQTVEGRLGWIYMERRIWEEESEEGVQVTTI